MATQNTNEVRKPARRTLKSDPTAEIVRITPKLAEEWLTRNTHNRRLDDKYVQKLARSMKDGEWKVNGEAIKWGSNDTILDGQHRLWAIFESGATVESLVVFNVEPEVQDTMDGGRKRSLADVLQLRGEVNCAPLSTTINFGYVWEVHGGDKLKSQRHFSPTTKQAIDFLADHPELREVAKFTNKIRQRVKNAMPESTLGPSYWMFSRINYDDAVAFFDGFSSPEELPAGDPRHLLRQYCQNILLKPYRIPSWHLTAITVKAWNMFRDGKLGGQLKFTPGGSNPEKFPVPR